MADATALRTRRRPAPRRGLVYAYVPVYLPPGCSEEQADALILKAFEREVEMRGGTRAAPARPVADLPVPATRSPASPTHCRTVEQFVGQLDQLRAWAGLSLRVLEQRAQERGYPPLPHSSIGRLLSPRRGAEDRMPTREQLTSIVLCCDVPEAQWREWAIIWERVQPDPLQMNKPWVLPGGTDGPDRVVSLRSKSPNLRATAERLMKQLTAHDDYPHSAGLFTEILGSVAASR